MRGKVSEILTYQELPMEASSKSLAENELYRLKISRVNVSGKGGD
jgi:hypothetical protein